MVTVTLSSPSYSENDVLSLRIDFSSNLELLKKFDNININITRIDKQRNYFVLGFGSKPDVSSTVLEISQPIPDEWIDGLYLVGEIKLIKSDQPQTQVRITSNQDVPTLFFWYSRDSATKLTEAQLAEKINQLNRQRGEFINTVLTTSKIAEAASTAKAANFRVLIFGVGCLVHSQQLMEGYTLHPLGRGYEYSHMIDAVNSFLEPNYGIKLARNERIGQTFGASTPLFVIEFRNIKALDHNDAGQYCTSFSEDIFTILAYEKGQRPNQFASVIINTATNEILQAFHFPGYRGNLVSDFNASSTADTIERVLPKINSSPWIDLLMKTYADAQSEQNPNYACFKFWSILEMVAKKEIISNTDELTYPDGNKIYDLDGKVVKTKYALGKVYKHVLDSCIPPSFMSFQNETKLIFETHEDATKNPNTDANTKVIKLWEFLCALYEIRNSTAHSGKFDPNAAKLGGQREQLAATLWELEHQTFVREVRTILKIIVAKEINKA